MTVEGFFQFFSNEAVIVRILSAALVDYTEIFLSIKLMMVKPYKEIGSSWAHWIIITAGNGLTSSQIDV